MAIRPLIALLGAAAVLLAGCTGSGSGSTAATDSANPGAPTKGGTLTVAIDSDPGQLNPAITTSGGTHTASELIYNGLVDLTPDLKPVPDLAESWDVLDNGALYRFHLRQGVKWHDGAPFTSADVKFTFEQMLLKFHSRTKASVGAALQSIATPDTDTVEFRFAKPYAPLLLQLNVTEAPILPKHLYEGTDVQKNTANSKPIGTGPYKLVSYKPGAELRFAANRDYYKKDLPNLDQVVMRIIPDQGSQVAALEAGEVDWLFGAPGPDLPRLKNSGNYGFLTTPVNPGGSNCIMTVSFNLDRPMFQDVRLRHARNFDTNIISYCSGADPEIGVKRMYVSSDIGAVPFSNSSGYRNPKVDQLFEQARTTVDPAARTSIYRNLQKQIVADLPYVGVVETESTRVFTDRCRDFSAAGHFAETASCSK
jgi:peptide/nickel transport system substrate-binding protein